MLLVLLAWVEDIYNLCNSFGEYPRVIFVANFGQVNNRQAVVVHFYTLWVFDPLAPKHRNLYGPSIVKLPYVLYKAKI